MKKNRNWKPVTDGDEYYDRWIEAMIKFYKLTDKQPEIDENLSPEQTPQPDSRQEATQPELFHIEPEVSPSIKNPDPDVPGWDPKGKHAPGFGERVGPRRKPELE